LTLDMVSALTDRDAAPDVLTASPVISSSQNATYEGTTHSVPQFVGTYPAYLSAANYLIGSGSAFTESDVTEGRKVVVIGLTVAQDLFADTSPIGKQITVNGVLFTVIGVFADKGGAGFNDPNDVAMAPLTAVQQSLTGYSQLNQILVQATSPDTVNAAQAEVT